MATAIDWKLVDAVRAARARWEDHFDGCRTCGCPGYCANGERLHTAYATLKTRLERGR